MIDPQVLARGLVDFLELQTGKPCGLADIPSERLPRPFMVLYPLPGPPPEGSYGDDHDMRDMLYQVSCVGDTAEQAQWMSAKAAEAWLLHGKEIVSVVGRWIDSFGSIVRQDDETYVVADTYRMKVQA